MPCFPRALRRLERETRARYLKRAAVRADVSRDGDERSHTFCAQFRFVLYINSIHIAVKTTVINCLSMILSREKNSARHTSNISGEKTNRYIRKQNGL